MDSAKIKPIELKNVSSGYGSGRDKVEILHDISYEFEQGKSYGILGPNGSGKTTFLRTLIRETDYSGNIRIFDHDLRELKRREIAKFMALLLQYNDNSFDFTVRETVRLGNYAAKEDITDRVLEELSLEKIADKKVRCLSGGQKQRVSLARTLAQNTPVILLDEPMNSLDIKYQSEISGYLKKWISEAPDRVLIGVYHDINLARMLSDELIFVRDGRIIESGAEADIDYPKVLEKTYDMDVYDYMKKQSELWR